MSDREYEKQTITVRHERHPSDSYDTPPKIGKWCVDHCVELLKKHGGEKKHDRMTMLEPGCGDGAPFSRYAASLGISSFGTDVRADSGFEVALLDDELTNSLFEIERGQNFLDPADAPTKWEEQFDIIATNPPFKFGQKFIEHSFTMLNPKGVACFLTKMAFLSSRERMTLFQGREPAEVHVLIQRPSFAHGATDKGQEYCLMFWLGTEIAKKVRRNRGGVPRLYWQDNKQWKDPVYK